MQTFGADTAFNRTVAFSEVEVLHEVVQVRERFDNLKFVRVDEVAFEDNFLQVHLRNNSNTRRIDLAR